MEKLTTLSRWISSIAVFFGGICLLIIILFTMTDVVTRYLFKLTSGGFGFTLKGSVEVISYCMFFALLSAFAAFVERSQIIVDIFTQKLPHAVKANLMGVFVLLFAIVGVVFAWGLYANMQDAIRFGNVTQDLRLPMAPIYGIGAILSLLMSVRAVIESVMIFKTKIFHNAEEA